MARTFDDASSEYLQYNGAVASAAPITLAAWFNMDSDPNEVNLISICNSGAANEWFTLEIRGTEVNDPVCAWARSPVGVNRALSSAGPGLNAWHHAAGVFVSSSERHAYFDGGSKGSNTDTSAPSGVDQTAIGRRCDSSPSAYWSGSIAEAAIWNAALSDAEVAILAEGFSPLFVKPENLVAYWPLIRDEDQDRVGGYDMTAYNTPSVSDHPPVIYPAPPFISVPVAAAVGDAVVQMMHQARLRRAA